MKRIIIPAAIIVTVVSLTHLLAQDKKRKVKEKPKAEQHIADTAIVLQDEWQPQRDSATSTHYFLFPEFYSFWPADNNDTILKYECFDINHDPILMDTLTNADDIHYITAVSTYNDYLKTYIDPEGKPRPKPISKTVFTFERTGRDTWKSVDVASGTSYSLQEHKKNIVRKDTTIVANSITGGRQVTIREYYKITEVEGSEAAAATLPGSEITASQIHYYTVPEFYFHWPKKVRDTSFEFECYDERDSLIPEVENYDAVHYYSLLKKFSDSTHTYKDNDGNKKPLPVSLIVKRYDQKGRDKWISVEYPQNRFTELKAFKDNIVSIDTETVTDPVTGHEQMKIFRHYSVIKN